MRGRVLFKTLRSLNGLEINRKESEKVDGILEEIQTPGLLEYELMTITQQQALRNAMTADAISRFVLFASFILRGDLQLASRCNRNNSDPCLLGVWFVAKPEHQLSRMRLIVVSSK
jgi:hypothetical protein